jgi:hypothetical protein
MTARYADGREIKISDRVRLADDSSGVVIYLIAERVTGPDVPSGAWDYLNSGVMIELDKYGLHHYPRPEEEPDLTLIRRA